MVKLDIPYIKALSKITGGISLFIGILDKANTIDMDNIALFFWDNVNVSRVSSSVEALDAAMKKSYEFLGVNDKYFFGQTVFGNSPFF